MSKIWIKSDKIETKFKKYLSKFNSDFFFQQVTQELSFYKFLFWTRLESFGPDQKKPSLPGLFTTESKTFAPVQNQFGRVQNSFGEGICPT